MAGRLGSLLGRALDWCADGLALLEADGTMRHAKTAFASIARAHDGIAIRKGVVAVADGQMSARLAAALAAMLGEENFAVDTVPIDFQVPRLSGAPAYVISIRPLHPASARRPKQRVAALFVRDLATRGAGDAGVRGLPVDAG